jgi:uncharacterized membrane protein
MKRDTEGSLQNWVSVVLRTGVLVSALIALVGTLLNLSKNASEKVSYQTFHSGANLSVGSVFRNALSMDSRSIMLVAVIVLVLTPVARVIVALFGFIKEKDRIYIAITSVVLLTLLFSVIGGFLRG